MMKVLDSRDLIFFYFNIAEKGSKKCKIWIIDLKKKHTIHFPYLYGCSIFPVYLKVQALPYFVGVLISTII